MQVALFRGAARAVRMARSISSEQSNPRLRPSALTQSSPRLPKSVYGQVAI